MEQNATQVHLFCSMLEILQIHIGVITAGTGQIVFFQSFLCPFNQSFGPCRNDSTLHSRSLMYDLETSKSQLGLHPKPPGSGKKKKKGGEGAV